MSSAPDSLCDPRHAAIFTRRYVDAADGIPVAVKDCIDIAGEATTSGCRALAGTSPASKDAEVVRQLKAAGCRIVGRANMHELAYGVTGLNAWTGSPTNPNYPGLVPGGSSSGSAVAVAAGLVDFALGTDTGGSVRVPATCCGIVGLKPSFGRVSREGVHPAKSSLDCVGVFARDIATIEQAMSVIADDWQGHHEAGASATVGYFAPDGEAAINTLVREKAAEFFNLSEADLPGFNDASDAGLTIIGRESWNAVGHLTETGLVGRDVHDRLLMSSKITDAQLEEAEAVRTRFSTAVDVLLEKFDAIALPAMTHHVPTLLEAASASAPKPITLACRPFNLSGHPAIALPVGEIEGRPVSLQLVGRKGGDEALCALARKVTIFRKGEV